MKKQTIRGLKVLVNSFEDVSRSHVAIGEADIISADDGDASDEDKEESRTDDDESDGE
jgi:hypothetical protein